MKIEQNIGILGLGQMALALAQRMIESKTVAPSRLRYSRRSDADHPSADKLGIQRTDNRALWVWADILILAVKPQDVATVFAELKGETQSPKLVLSVLGGVTLDTLRQGLPPGGGIARAMPNIPVQVGAGCTTVCFDDDVPEQSRQTLFDLLRCTGKLISLPTEALLDAAVALNGCGPAYAYLMLEAMADGGVRAGLPAHLALELSAHAILGAATMWCETGQDPRLLRQQITSPAGITAEALNTLEQRGFRGALLAAIEAAGERSRALK